MAYSNTSGYGVPPERFSVWVSSGLTCQYQTSLKTEKARRPETLHLIFVRRQ